MRGSACFWAAQPFVSAHGQSQQGQNEILMGGAGLSAWEKGRAALWGAGSTWECGAEELHTTRAVQHQPHAPSHALHTGTRPVHPSILPFLGVTSGFGDSKASQLQPFPWELSKEQPKSSHHPGMGQGTSRCPTPTSQQPHSKAQDINICLWRVVTVESLDTTVSQVASSPPA